MAGAEKSPGGNEGETCVRRLARAISRADRAGANARGRAQARTQDTRAKRVPPLEDAQAGGGAEGLERNGMRGRERYAGTEPQTFGDGMRNMTIHDTMQGSPMNRPPRLRWGCMHTPRLALYPVRPTARPRPAPRLFRRTRALLFVTPAPEPGSSPWFSMEASAGRKTFFRPGCGGHREPWTGPRLGGRGDGLGHMQRHATGWRCVNPVGRTVGRRKPNRIERKKTQADGAKTRENPMEYSGHLPETAASCPKRQQPMLHAHADHDAT